MKIEKNILTAIFKVTFDISLNNQIRSCRIHTVKYCPKGIALIFSDIINSLSS